MKTSKLCNAAAAALVICAPHVFANPLTDSDGDGVFDEEPDYCPTTPGTRWNDGCPANTELVVVRGYGGSVWVECPGGGTAAFWAACPSYGTGWGTFYVAHMSQTGAGVIRTEALADEDGDGIYDESDECQTEAGLEDFEGCLPETYCYDNPTLKCFHWASQNLPLRERGEYYEALQDFAEGGCGGDATHWACLPVKEREPITWESFWDTIASYWPDGYRAGLVPPQCPEGYMPQGAAHSAGGFVFYAGTCINTCRNALFTAGLLTTAGGASTIAITTAGRAALLAFGVALQADQLVPICDGPTWISPLD